MPKLTVTNLLAGPYVLQDATGMPGEDGLSPFSMSLDETGHAGGTDVKSASVTKEQLEHLRPILDAAQTASKITWKFEDDSADSADNARKALRVAIVTPDVMTVKDEVVVTKLTIAGAVAVTLPASPPVGMEIQVQDGTGDAAANNVTISPATGTINGGATLVINVNRGVAKLVRTPTEWIGYVSSSISSGAAGGDLAGTYPNPTIGANKVLESSLALTIAGAGQALSGAGAVDVTHRTTYFTSTGAGQALTLADGTRTGQRKTIVHAVDGGSGTLTPTNPEFFATVVFTAVRDAVELEWTGTHWRVVGYSGVTFT